MDQKEMFKQMIEFNKTAFENSFKAMVTLQDQNEKMVNTFLEQTTWLPQEGKKVINEWVSSYKKAREEFKKMVDLNFVKVEDFFSAPKKAENKSKDQEV